MEIIMPVFGQKTGFGLFVTSLFIDKFRIEENITLKKFTIC